MEHGEKVKQKINEADAVVIGGGSGLSAAAGYTYSGERFQRNFAEFIARYGLKDMYSAGFYPFPTKEEKWAYWSRHICCNRYDQEQNDLYMSIRALVEGRDHFVITTNVDHQFQAAGFDEERIFATQGDYGRFQCAKACHDKLYDNEEQVREMVKRQRDCRIPSSLIPKCPVCGGDMEVHLRCDGYFVEDSAWHEALNRYEEFIRKNRGNKILFLELGVGMNTPGIIKYPFWQMTADYEQAFYICLNKGQAWAPQEITEKALCIDADIADVVKSLQSAGPSHGEAVL